MPYTIKLVTNKYNTYRIRRIRRFLIERVAMSNLLSNSKIKFIFKKYHILYNILQPPFTKQSAFFYKTNVKINANKILNVNGTKTYGSKMNRFNLSLSLVVLN